MNFQVLNTQLRRARQGRNATAALLVAMIVANVGLSIRLAVQNDQVVLVPTRVSDGMVARGSVDVRYMEALALDAVYAMYTTSPNTTSYGRAVVERVAAASQRGELVEQFDEVARDIIERKISTVFFPDRIEHNPAALQIIVYGELGTYLETMQVAREARSILLTFVQEGAGVRLARIERLKVSPDETSTGKVQQ